MKFRHIPILAAFSLILGAPAWAQPASAGLIKAWPKDGAWLTELRRDADGSYICVTGAPFTSPHGFVLEIASRPDIFALMLVDQSQPGGVPASRMAVTLDGTEVASLPILASGPARLTPKEESARVRQLVPRMAQAQAVSLVIGPTAYAVDPDRLADASRTLAACERQMQAQ
jgi:hypothetical protein